MNPKNILLIWIGRVGDFIVSTPFLASVRQAFPEAHITLLVRSTVSDLANLDPNLNECCALSFSQFLSVPFKKFDLVIDLNPSYSRTSGFLSLLTHSPRRISFQKKRGNLFYTDQVPFDEKDHMLERYRKLAKYMGNSLEPFPQVYPLSSHRQEAGQILSRLNLNKDRKLIGIHPGNFKKFDHRWPEEKFVELTKKLTKVPQIQILYLTGPGEEEPIRKILEKIPVKIPQVPPTSLPVSAALIKKLSLLIANVTGTLHLAAAVGTPTLSFHSGYTYQIWRPLRESHAAIVSKSWASCRDISVEEAWKKLYQIVVK
ncbi:MAG: glycosyltransferase family 9 protein [Elusimicrobia bacterium]|nr:glycosyltransferase family 9 protein [Elusimicrobiota bacterium]